MSTIFNRTRLGHAILLALLASAQASAQEVTKPDAADSSTLGTIIVTAEKRSEDIQQVPMSIGVIGETELENLHATQLADYAGYIPGFTVVNGGSPGQAMLGIRGVSPLSAGSTVATYIDETPLGTSSNYGGGSTDVLDLLPYDFQSVEVLRGPQGTLYGAVALGGVLRYVTKQPDLDQFSWRAGADAFNNEGGSDAGYGGHVGFNAPIVAGQLALSGSFARQDSPGFTDNARTGEKDQDSFSQQVARVSMLWKANDALSVKLQAIQSKIDSDSSSATALDPITLKPVYGDLKDDNFVPEPFKKDVHYYNATVNWDVGFADFVSATSYAENTQHSVLDASLVYGVLFPLFGLPSPGISAVSYDLKLYKTTQEFRLTSKSDGPWEWLLGAFYTDENSKQNQAASAKFLDGSSIPGLDPLAVIALPSTYKETAFFGDLTYKFNTTFDVTGGIRSAHNEQTFSQISSGALLGGSTTVSGASSEDVLTWSFSPRMHLTPDQMVYVRIATGYQPGGPNVALPGVPPSVDSSTLTNYEIGWKAMFDDNRWMLDIAAYDIEWDKIQVSAAANGLAYLANGGKAQSSGFEMSTLYSPIAGLRLGLNGAYTDAKLSEDVPALGGLRGDRLPAIPKWAWSATADYSWPVFNDWTGRVGGGIRYVGDTFSGVEHSANVYPQDSYSVVDLNADMSNEHWTVRLYIKNLTDERVYTNLTALPNAATGQVMQVKGVPLSPRTIGIGFDAKF
ncbi:MAG TPA: TonB-dependent receptor [Rudaea sp.]|nr:TonB-dependent receptor [Rudaea sp.]